MTVSGLAGGPRTWRGSYSQTDRIEGEARCPHCDHAPIGKVRMFVAQFDRRMECDTCASCGWSSDVRPSNTEFQPAWYHPRLTIQEQESDG